jgi:hypothetical protein
MSHLCLRNLLLLCLFASVLTFYHGRPTSRILNVPYFRQVTDFACGDASLQMLLAYWGVNVSQYTLMDVMRSTIAEGTSSFDLVRASHFSSLSSSTGRIYPDFAVKAGYPGHPIGLASFWHDSTKPWLNHLKDWIGVGVPVIALMHFEPNGTNDGHYRVVVGYDDDKKLIMMNDPWDRGTPRFLTWTENDFVMAWNYVEDDSPRVNPFFGMTAYPFRIHASTHKIVSPSQNVTLVVTANITYPCGEPWDCTSYPVSNLMASLTWNPKQLDQKTMRIRFVNGTKQTTNLGHLSPKQTKTAHWFLQCPNGVCPREFATISAYGVIQGTVPDEFSDWNQREPAYDYIDAIGGTVAINLAETSPDESQ